MRLEDALFYVIIDRVPASGLPAFCESLIAGGVDVIHLADGLLSEAAAVREVCRRVDALLVLDGDAAAVREAGADGVHIPDPATPVGHCRALLGDRGIVGVSTHSRNDALLALEVGVDYVLHWAGTGCAAEFAALPGAAGNALFAAGLSSLDDARVLVDAGVYRICVNAALLEPGDPAGNAASFSRVLGRSI